jgi:large subunit ribosomal protein L4
VLARKSALAYKAQENAIIVVEDFTLEAPKTKSFIEILNNLKISGKKALFVLPGNDKVVYLSSRNIERVNVMAASALNTYKVLDADVMVVAEGALPVIEGNLNK